MQMSFWLRHGRGGSSPKGFVVEPAFCDLFSSYPAHMRRDTGRKEHERFGVGD